MSNRNWSQLKDWDREAVRLEKANAAGVDLEDIILPGDENPALNIVLRNRLAAEADQCENDIKAEDYDALSDNRDDLPRYEDMMLFDALDGSIDGSFDVL